MIKRRFPEDDGFGLKAWLNPDYNYDFDDYLVYDLGYSALATESASIFPTPYAITSLDEYFSIIFESCFSQNANVFNRVLRLCPITVEKIMKLIES